MNAIQDCVAALQRIGQQIRAALPTSAAADQFGSPPEEVAAQEMVMCGCGKDACQIGDGPNACKPQKQAKLIAESEVL